MNRLFYEHIVKRFFALPGVRDIPLDAAERTLSALKIIKQKPFLKKIYEDIYKDFKKIDEGLGCLGGVSLEIGSGAGFLKDIIPTVITSDILRYDHVDRVENAYNLNFDTGALKAIYMVDVLHHLGDAKQFFQEADRCLRSGGKIVMVEPYASFWGKLQYKYLHHEAFDDNVREWNFPDKGPLSSSNSALPSIIFHRDKRIFESLFKNIEIENIRYHTFLLYILSGGLSMKQLMPNFTYSFFKSVEDLLDPLMEKYLGSFQTIVLSKKNEKVY